MEEGRKVRLKKKENNKNDKNYKHALQISRCATEEETVYSSVREQKLCI